MESEISGKQIFGGIVAFIILILAITWVAQGNNFFLYKVFAPKEEAVRRQTFEESKAYNDGMAQEIQSMQFEYIKADQAGKDALASVILQKTAAYDISRLPQGQREFVEQLRRERTTQAPAISPSAK